MDCFSAHHDALFLAAQLVSGLAIGSVYALVALGLVLIYRATDVVNLAQGDLLLLGAYVGWALSSAGLPFGVAFALTLLIAAALGVGIERLLLRRLLGSPVIGVLIATLGVSSILRGLVFAVAGTEVRRFPDEIVPSAPLRLGPFLVAPIHLWALALAAAVVTALTLFFRCTRQGIALRAAADDQQAAMSMGIRIRDVFGLSWALSVSVAAAGGIVLANLTGLNFTLADAGARALPVVILGGLDSLVGGVVGGLLVGVLQNTAAGYLDGCVGGGLKDVVPFVAMVLILMLKPHGLFGRARIERV